MTKDEARAKAAKLLNLATNPGASVEEARSAAMACCKLLKARELLSVVGTTVSAPGASSWTAAGASWTTSSAPFDFSSVFGVDGRTKPRAESSPLRVCDVCGTIRPITDKSKNWCNVCLEGV